MDIIGKRYGRWTVIADTGRRSTYGTHIYKCRCDCGTVRDVDASSLNSRRSKSCGCWRAERTAMANKTQKIRAQRSAEGIAQWGKKKLCFGLTDNTSISKIKSTKPRVDNHTGVRGVSEISPGVFIATLQFRKTQHRSGRFYTIEDAAKARQKMYEEYVVPYLEGIGHEP